MKRILTALFLVWGIAAVSGVLYALGMGAEYMTGVPGTWDENAVHGNRLALGILWGIALLCLGVVTVPIFDIIHHGLWGDRK